MDEPTPRAVTWPGRAAGELALVAGVAAVGVVAVTAELAAASSHRQVPPLAGGFLLTVAAAAALAGRRRWPVGTAAAVTALCWLYRAVGYPGLAPGTALFATCYAVAARPSGRREARHRGVVAACVVAASAVPLLPPASAPVASWPVAGPALGLVISALVGGTTRRRHADATNRVARAAAVAEATTARRMAEERMAIARELHDVLAHTISVITVQSGLALDALDDAPAQTRAALETIRASSREAMQQLRVSVGGLRGNDPSPLPRGSVSLTPAGLGALAERAREAGFDVRLEAAGLGAPETLPPLVQVTAYRVVQEALTNCVRHCRGRSVLVRLSRDGARLTVEVADDGARPTEAPEAAPGTGLTGMRERVEGLGGTLTTGWQADAGFRVQACLPAP